MVFAVTAAAALAAAFGSSARMSSVLLVAGEALNQA
jgi:hypothetical protein